jgi:hypothetical protein
MNIRPEAVPTMVSGTPGFIDLNNTNGQEIETPRRRPRRPRLLRSPSPAPQP